jgi:PHP family Zn ribbon phosphoesterase
MTIPGILEWSKKKGIDIIATGDWTHPLWMKEIQEHLEENGNGFLRLKEKYTKKAPSNDTSRKPDPVYLLATEVSCIYSQAGKGRRVHTLIWVPSLGSALNINKELTRRGCNLLSDGRPIIGLTSIEVAELVFGIDEKALVIPAHVWTPWFSVFGSMSGFNSISEAFGPYADRIFAVETGLSSNPSMNWQIPELDNRTIISFSDAHSGPKLGREATVFDLSECSYDALYDAISERTVKKKSSKGTIAYTIEFYPEEGKYHYSGHRACGIRWNPEETRKNGTNCPVCGKPLIQGVMQRVEQLANKTESDVELYTVEKELKPGGAPITMRYSKVFPKRPPFVMLVPLYEILAEVLEVRTSSKKVDALYTTLIEKFENEFSVLLYASLEEIQSVGGERLAKAVEKVRKGDIYIDPGYDGVFGVVTLWKHDEDKPLLDTSKVQLSLLS